jgi:hypothetical protein
MSKAIKNSRTVELYFFSTERQRSNSESPISVKYLKISAPGSFDINNAMIT